MKRLALLLLLPLLLLSACSGESAPDDATVLPEFYSNLQVWLGGGSPAPACEMLSEGALADARPYARAATGGNLCRAALEENFSFLFDGGEFRLLSVTTIDKAEKEKQRGSVVWVQPIEMKMEIKGQPERVLSPAAAVVENGKITSLSGMRLSTVAPEQFAENIGSPTVIRVDPVLAAKYSSR